MYQMTKWQDHVTSPSSCYHINKTPDTESDVYTITPAGTVMEQGTPQELFQNPKQERTRSFLAKVL